MRSPDPKQMTDAVVPSSIEVVRALELLHFPARVLRRKSEGAESGSRDRSSSGPARAERRSFPTAAGNVGSRGR